MKFTKVGDWHRARMMLGAAVVRTHRSIQRAVKQEAQYFRAKVLKAFQTRGNSNGITWAPNAPSTIARKGSSKPLIDTGQLRGSIQVVQSGDVFFVGVPSFSMRDDGKSMVSIGAIHEYGTVIAQTRGDSMVLIQIPQRSFIQSTADAHFQPEDVRKRFMARFAHDLSPYWAIQMSGRPPTR